MTASSILDFATQHAHVQSEYSLKAQSQQHHHQQQQEVTTSSSPFGRIYLVPQTNKTCEQLGARLMSAFSFTAPYISPEQEQDEYSSFPEETRAEILNDLHGRRDWEEKSSDKEEEDELQAESSLDNDATTTTSLQLLQETLESLPFHEKAEYLQALERVPHLVTHETPGESFLRAARWDPWAAASRLVGHWKFRRDLFGPDRAFLPMTLEGAMRDDRHVFALGGCALLPPDAAGRSAIFFNRIACTRAVAPREVFVSRWFISEWIGRAMAILCFTLLDLVLSCLHAHTFSDFLLMVHAPSCAACSTWVT